MTATYIKLQDAYASEANKFGSWYLIGYIAPGAQSASVSGKTASFEYYGGSDPAITATDGTALTPDLAFNEVWGAVNTAALNECESQTATTAADAHWTIKAKAASNGNSLVYKATVNSKCKQLTPTFEDITSKGWTD